MKPLRIIIASVSLLYIIPIWSENYSYIDAIPYKIEKSGYYKVGKNLKLDDLATNAITISSNNVELDFNHHVIWGPLSEKGSGAGVYAQNVDSAVITNGTIKGFLYGVRIDGGDLGESSRNVIINNMLVKDNFFRGIAVEAKNSIISNNRILNTGRTSLFPDAYAIAIEVKGKHCSVRHNIIDGIFSTGVGEGVGISLSNSRKGTEVICNIIKTPSNSHATYGIWITTDQRIEPTLICSNQINGFIYPFSVPREKNKSKHITINFKNNLMNDIGCTPINYQSYYTDLPISNYFVEKGGKCPMLVHLLSKHYAKNQNNPRTTFHFAMALSLCADDPHPDDIQCCEMGKKAIQLLRLSAAMGLKEASRVLPRVTKEVSNECTQNMSSQFKKFG